MNEELLLIVLRAKLTPLQLDVLLDSALLDRRNLEIAPDYGVTAQAVYRTLERARDKMRVRLDQVAA